MMRGLIGVALRLLLAGTLLSTIGNAADSPEFETRIARFTMPEGGVCEAPAKITWSEAPTASAYYLYVGTSPGAKDLYQSGEIKATSVTLKTLPVNRTLHLRLNTKIGSQWHFVDRSLVVLKPAKLQEPADGAFLPPGPADFRWESVEGAEAYRLSVGSAPGTADLFRSTESALTSVRVSGLPVNRTLHARLETKVLGQWHAQDSRLLLAQPASLASPGADELLGEDRQFRWQPVEQAESYYLYVGTSPGAKDIYQSGETKLTAITLKDLPANRPLHARLNTKIAGRWHFTDRGVIILQPARLSSPADNATLPPGPADFRWEPVTGAEAYRLFVGSAPDQGELFASGETSNTSAQAVSLPPNRLLHARLETKIAGRWHARDSRLLIGHPAELEIPDASGLLDEKGEFRWQSVENAEAYFLYVGTTPGGRDLYQSGETTLTSVRIKSLPANARLHARLNTKVGGRWIYVDRVFQIVTKARLIAPANNAVLESQATTFRWEQVAGADSYRLSVGTAVGSADIFTTGTTSETSAHRAEMPVNRRLYTRLETRVNGRWYANDTNFLIAQPAEFINPAPGSIGLSRSEPVTWTAVENATAYALHVSTAAGKKDIYSSGETESTEIFLPPINSDRTLYLELWTKIAGTWYSRSLALPPIAALLKPAPETHLNPKPTTFSWRPISQATAYRLQVWSKLDNSDLQDSGPITGTKTSITPPEANGAIRTRLWTQVDGRWLYTNRTFNARTRFIQPSPDARDGDASAPLEWLAVPLSSHYSLRIGSAPGKADVYQNDRIAHFNGLPTIRHFVPGLPLRVKLFATVTAYANNLTFSASTSFSLGSRGDISTHSIEAAQWAMRSVNAMANDKIRPYLGTRLELWISRKNRPLALCIDYAEVLRDIINELELGGARAADIFFLGNEYDGHTLVEFTPIGASTGIMLDPTFNLVAKRKADGNWATLEDISKASRARRWADIDFISTGQAVSQYYLDYPLLFLNIKGSGEPAFPVREHLEQVPAPVGQDDMYTIRSQSSGPITAIINGEETTLECSGDEHLSKVFRAHTVTLSEGLEIYRVRRYVFPRPTEGERPRGSAP